MQTSQAFGQVQDSLSFIITSYTDIAEWRAVVLRLLGFERALERVRARPRSKACATGRRSGHRQTWTGVDLELPDGRP